MKDVTLIAPCFFGVEKILKREIENLGCEIQKVEDGRITYKTDSYGICKSNLWLRTAERVLLKIGEFEARSFEELFQNTKKLPWHKYIKKDAVFPVAKASSIKSKLYSIPDIQSIVKKAVVENLKQEYKVNWFDENSDEKYPIYVFIHKDKVTISIDTCGQALHKRGYRENASKAPIRETLAAAIVSLTPWKQDRILVDPFCGSGTILIEAAMMGLNMAPGLNREFLSENWSILGKKLWWKARKEAFDMMKTDVDFKIYGYDIDDEVLEIAKENARLADVDNYIEFKKQDARNLESDYEYGFVITNPPYGERLEDKDSVRQLYKEISIPFKKLSTWSFYIITAYSEFEDAFGRKADRKRKLYNGMLRSDLYQYYGPKPLKK
ncbi:THUMP domain-containing class I SAM-dependent RNA methyltransferase [Tepidibacter aestuarii]|uniref:THUMP domain-containing class I SAM-dependent RNA methyltransferase n=1 Tax=Tepidibacter aestuarii TaxID=2925782 RepID=UPI0020C0EFD9|nr:class I SAM-dependent RNA methyltransferase [Tepidibacter aestuarii]CAH2213671.1 putative RNA methyltransferase YpsC [Tepidibacter aestuarii]CAH2215676.1 putative RNA methyltransferase YpsC [Tepidibacter aestuarii]